MEAMEAASGTINDQDGDYTTTDDDAAAPSLSKKELKAQAKEAAKKEEKERMQQLKKRAKKLGLSVEELEKMDAEGGGEVGDEVEDVDGGEEVAVYGEVSLLALIDEYIRVLCCKSRTHIKRDSLVVQQTGNCTHRR